jgi:hypothetical protein
MKPTMPTLVRFPHFRMFQPCSKLCIIFSNVPPLYLYENATKTKKNYYNVKKKFGGRVWGVRLGRDTPQAWHKAEESPKRSIWHCLGSALRYATGDALRMPTSVRRPPPHTVDAETHASPEYRHLRPHQGDVPSPLPSEVEIMPSWPRRWPATTRRTRWPP